MTRRRKGAIAVLVATIGAVAVLAAGSASAATKTVVIGWAFDGKGPMAPFDGPALAAAQLRIAQWNAKSASTGVKLQLKTCNTQGDVPAISKSCALKLIGQGANVVFTTCDVELAAPVVQEAINRGILAVAPCIGTDQMGPKRFGAKGKLAFSFGNVAQDEGSAMAQYAWARGWRSAALATDTVIIYFRNVVQAFAARWKQLGGKVVAQETYQSDPTGAGKTSGVPNVISRLSNVKADVIVTATAPPWGAQVPIMSALRSAGNDTPIINSWAGDGAYWLPKDPKVSNYYFVTYASIFGDDPVPAVNKLAKQVKAGTGGFLAGPAAIDGIVTAVRRAGGSTNGATLASVMEKFHNVPTLSGLVSFSPQLHSVFGRQYRVIKIQDNVPKRVGVVTAKVVPKI
jgi:branched-chain amino acid transport system substrate-binding protein